MTWSEALSELLDNPRELWAVAICSVLGFWAVSKFLAIGVAGRNSRDDSGQRSERDPTSGAGAGTGEGAREDANQRETKASSSESAQWFDVLGVSQNASVGEIKSAYRRRISEYHPDKVATLGTELRELAEKKSRTINEAYRVALLLRGE